MTDYEPGWYLGTVKGEPNTRLLRTTTCWWFLGERGGACMAIAPTDVRPAVVLDSADWDVQTLTGTWKGARFGGYLTRLADKIDAQMPKPPEPTGRWAVVIDTDGEAWVRTTGVRRPWLSVDDARARAYADIKVERVAFEGLS